MKFNYKWFLKDFPEKNNLKVFSCFAGGGGSSMGYKLAGCDVIGCNEIDPKMIKLYLHNLKPKHFFNQPIQEFKNNPIIPEELFNLDILDGSPPCSTFSILGKREKYWGEERKFKEGQAKQILSDLFFDFIDLTARLKPKIAIAENVKGLLMKNAKGYVSEIVKRFNAIGYDVQIFLFNAASMGVPQIRERVFFICRRKDLNLKPIKFDFKEKAISFHEATQGLKITPGKPLSDLYKDYWIRAEQGESVGKFLSCRKIYKNRPLFTIKTGDHFHHSEQRILSKEELSVCGTFPLDYNFLDQNPAYIIGMSVPPVMIAQIASVIIDNWL